MEISDLLAFAVKNKASDLHLSAGLPPMIRVHGDIRRINVPALDHNQVKAMVYDIMSDTQRKMYEEHLEADNLAEVVKRLMQEQHKRVFIALRDGVYDEGGAAQDDGGAEADEILLEEVTTEVLEHAAARLVEGSPTYEQIRPGSGSHKRISQAPPVPFGHDLLTEKTLDEVILAYLAQDLETGT